jgi:exodeoxyribonuclease VII small subunit
MTGKRKNDAEKPGSAGETVLGFEESIARLEQIVADMEDGKLSLEDTIKRFEEGQGLIRLCTRKLNEVEKKVEILVKKGDQVTAEPFEASSAGGSESAEGDEGGKIDF